jgi:membrane-bound lytic murein transglycosylase D
MRTRGREYGLKQSKYHDDRFDPEKSTRAAARHLRDLYEQFGDWYLAIAAYNGGPGRVAQAVEHTGYADFWELYARGGLRRETANYLPIILAMTIMSKNARAYDLDDVQAEQPEAHDSVDLPSLTHLALVADITGRPLAEIRDLNPSVLNFLAPQGHQIHVPKGTAGMVAAALSAIPAERLASWRLHRVASEETLSALAQQYRTTEAKISEANRSAPEDLDLREGDLVIIPVSYPAKPDVLSNRRS